MTADPVLRVARAKFGNPEIGHLTGISGSPVFNTSTARLAGIVALGGRDGALATVRFMDIAHVAGLLSAIADGKPSIYYRTLVPT